MKRDQIVITNVTVEADMDMSLEELCEACDVTPDLIRELVEYGALDLRGIRLHKFRFDMNYLLRVRRLLRLHHELEVNMPGAVLIVELQDEMEKMRAHIETLEKHFKSTF